MEIIYYYIRNFSLTSGDKTGCKEILITFIEIYVGQLYIWMKAVII